MPAYAKGGFTIEPVRPHKRRRKSRTGMDVDPRQYEDMVSSTNHSFVRPSVCLSVCLTVPLLSCFNYEQCSCVWLVKVTLSFRILIVLPPATTIVSSCVLSVL